MSAVSENIVREFFETLGFLVQQPFKYQVGARRKRSEEEIDLLVINPKIARNKLPDTRVWGPGELKDISRAVVSVRPWHTERFSPSVLEKSPEVVRFTRPGAMRSAVAVLGNHPIAKILCVSALPASRDLRERALDILAEHEVDGVLQFRTMLLTLTADVDTKKSYDQSDLLQVLRILKNYDLLKDPQLELFGSRPRRSRKTG